MNLRKRLLSVAKIISNDDIFMYSAQASFYIIISALPFIMLILSLAQYILPVNESDIIKMLKPIIPDIIMPSARVIIDELFYKTSGSVISITAISSLWTASRGIAAIERGTRNVYHTPSRPMFIQDIAASIFFTILFALVMLLLLATSVFGNATITFLEVKSGFLCWLFGKTSWIKWLFTFAFLVIFFGLIYTAFAGRKIPLKRHFPGAVFTTLSWMCFSFLFSVYIENFANYSYVYGSLTAIVLMMLWVYFCMIIFLLGGEVNMTVLVYKLKQSKLHSQHNNGD